MSPAALWPLGFALLLAVALVVMNWVERREIDRLYGGINERAELRRALATDDTGDFGEWADEIREAS